MLLAAGALGGSIRGAVTVLLMHVTSNCHRYLTISIIIAVIIKLSEHLKGCSGLSVNPDM